jgi:nucleoside 2-deoxyribosyltransferase
VTIGAGLRIYFSASISGGREDAPRYAALISALAPHGSVLTEHIGSPDLCDGGEDGPADVEIYARDIGWLQEADVVIAEVTTPSLGVGYEVARAAGMGKPVVCLFRPESGRRLSAMIRGNPAVRVLEYASADDPEEVARRAIVTAMARGGA